MSFFHTLFLGVLQGVAEFLPVSSSGHLALAQNLFGFDDLPWPSMFSSILPP